MDFYVVLPTDIGLNSMSFVEDWNDEPTCCEIANARYVETYSNEYDLNILLTQGLIVLNSVALGVASNIIYDKVKLLFSKRGIKKDIKIEELDQGKGRGIFIVIVVKE